MTLVKRDLEVTTSPVLLSEGTGQTALCLLAFHLWSLFPQVLGTVRACQQRFSVIPRPFPTGPLSRSWVVRVGISLWPGQGFPLCMAMEYAFGKKKKLAEISTPCLISELKIDSLHCGKI